MNIIPYIKNAVAQPGYKLFLEFEDGVNGVINLEQWKDKTVFQHWDDEENFKSFKITADKKIEWSNEIDMDPDAFYLQLIGKTFEEHASHQQLLRDFD